MTNQKRGLYQGDMVEIVEKLEQIKLWRKCKGNELATLLNTSKATISSLLNWFNGSPKYRCHADLAERIIEQYEHDLKLIQVNIFGAMKRGVAMNHPDGQPELIEIKAQQAVEQENRTAAGFARDYTLDDLVNCYEQQERRLDMVEEQIEAACKILNARVLVIDPKPTLWQRFKAWRNKPVEVKS